MSAEGLTNYSLSGGERLEGGGIFYAIHCK